MKSHVFGPMFVGSSYFNSQGRGKMTKLLLSGILFRLLLTEKKPHTHNTRTVGFGFMRGPY